MSAWAVGGGNLCSTAGDLVAWVHALHGERVLQASSYRELLTPGHLTDGRQTHYAMGLLVDSLLGHRLIGHQGDGPGFAADVKYFPDDTLTIVVLQNTNGARAVQVSRAIAEAMFGRVTRARMALGADKASYVGGICRRRSRPTTSRHHCCR